MKNFYIIILMSLIGLTSCSGDAYVIEDSAIGNNETEWETGKSDDNIGLSTKEVAFGFDGGQATVNSKGRHWWITEIIVDGERLFSMDVDKDEMFQITETGNFTAQYGWLTIKMENWQMTFIAEPNYGDSERTFSIGLEAGDYFDRIEGRQAMQTSGIRPVICE